MSKKADFFLNSYLENRPLFLGVIRTPEALLFEKYSKYIKSPILDYGCGDGFFAETVFGKNTIDLGLDVKNDRTEKIVNERIYKKIIFYDGKKIPLKEKSQQTIVSNCVLEHVLNIEKAAEEIYRVLKPGGYFITSVMTDKWNDYLFGRKILGNKYVELMKKKQDHYNLFSLQKWSRLFNSAQFKIVHVNGYLDKQYSQFLDLAHYLSFPSLISYKLNGNWQPLPGLNTLVWKKFIQKRINIETDIKQSSALFYILRK